MNKIMVAIACGDKRDVMNIITNKNIEFCYRHLALHEHYMRGDVIRSKKYMTDEEYGFTDEG